jgi:hypothetical protein
VLKVFVFDVPRDGNDGMEPGVYAVHVTEDSAVLMFRPAGERSFRVGVLGQEE